MKQLLKISYFLSLPILLSCNQNKELREVTVINGLYLPRFSETVEIPCEEIFGQDNNYNPEKISVKDLNSNTYLIKQFIDEDDDGVYDKLIFQIDINSREKKKYRIEISDDAISTLPKENHTTFGRFVPERVDDFAWENDKVAFRIYGPEAQHLAEEGDMGGTLSSGVDCWLKKVSYPIIDKWYANNVVTPGYYHIDHGEGYDPYHVGSSLGCGGIGIWENNTLYTSKNFISYKVIANGPIRTIFEVTYKTWQTKRQVVNEYKRISIDLGSNLSKFEVELSGNSPINDCAIGITLHDKQGVVFNNPAEGWFSYWEPMDKSELGTAIVINSKYVNEYNDYRVNEPEKSHLFVFAHPLENKIIYYAGFGWKESGQFQNLEEWNQYLSNFSKRLSSPLVIKYR